MNLEDLPPEVIASFWASSNMQSRMQQRTVSPLIANIIEDLGRTTHSLKLFGNAVDIQKYCHALEKVHPSDLNYWSLDAEHSEDMIVEPGQFHSKMHNMLVRLFPNVQHLVLCFDKPEYFEQLPEFLYKLSVCDKLRSVSICGYYQLDNTERLTILHEILEALNSLSLTRLDLLTKLSEKNEPILDDITPFLRRILPRLTRFTSRWNKPLISFFNTLGAISRNCTYLDIRINKELTKYRQTPNPSLAMNTGLLSPVRTAAVQSLTHFYLRFSTYVDFKAIMPDHGQPLIPFDQMRSLQSLSLDCIAFVTCLAALQSLFREISRLPSLTDFELFYMFYKENDWNTLSVGAQAVTFPKVKRLVLHHFRIFYRGFYFFMSRRDNFTQEEERIQRNYASHICITLSKWFPALEHLIMPDLRVGEYFQSLLESHLGVFPNLISHRFCQPEEMARENFKSAIGRHKNDITFDYVFPKRS